MKIKIEMGADGKLLIHDSDYVTKIENYIEEKWLPFLDQAHRGRWEGENNTAIMNEQDHSRHDGDREYQEFILDPIRSKKDFWKGKKALDIGCGTGRNIRNLLSCADFERVDGCDISHTNSAAAKKNVEKTHGLEKCNTWRNNGYNLKPAKDGEYDFIMSHIVFQHIPNYLIRLSLLNDAYRVLNTGGMAVIHFMDLPTAVPYDSLFPYDEAQAVSTNCRVENAIFLLTDFWKLGFSDVNCFVGIDPFALRPSYYIRGFKK